MLQRQLRHRTRIRVLRLRDQELQRPGRLLTGTLAGRADAAIDRIARQLELDERDDDGARDHNDACLAHGDAGRAVFLSTLGRVRGLDAAIERAGDLIEQVVDDVGAIELPDRYLFGLFGIGWAIEYVRGHGALDADDTLCDAIDEAAMVALAGPGRSGLALDLVHGLVGMALYALERPADVGRPVLDAIVRELAARADASTWRNQDGRYDLGLAHGTPGVIVALAGAGRAQPLLDDAIAWLLAQRLDGGEARFASTFAPGERPPAPARAAWCYGDPGVACALLAAGRTDEALEIARLAALRPMDHCGAEHIGLCHGAAGLAHMFHRLYRGTGDVLVRDASIRWFERLLIALDEPPPEEKPLYLRGLLGGITGAGLALLGAMSDEDPTWDRALGMSLRFVE